MKIVVIGGGIVGVSTAWNLARTGADVTLLEARGLASGTSATSFAWLNSSSKTPLAYHRLNLAGMDEHCRIASESDSAPWLHNHGNVIWDDPAARSGHDEPDVPVRGESLLARVRRLGQWNYPVEWVSPRDVVETHPDLAVPHTVERAAWFPTEGYCDVPLLVAHLANLAQSHGAEVRTNSSVAEMILQRDRVSGVITDSGERIEADIVVGCVGRWTDRLTEMAGLSMPMAPTLGLLVTTSKIPVALRSLVHTPYVNLRPDGGSRLLLASYDIDGVLHDDMSSEDVRGFAEIILNRARTIVPALKWAEVDSVKVGTRSIPEDGFPSVGWLPGIDGYYSLATHSGITMGPLLGRIASAEVLAGRIDPLLETFRPARFVTSSGAQTVDTRL